MHETDGKASPIQREIVRDLSTKYVSETFSQPNVQLGELGNIWEPEQLEFLSRTAESISKENRKQKCLPQPRYTTCVVWTPSVI